MGQKIHPYSFRIGVVYDWKSKWYSDKDYVELVNEDADDPRLAPRGDASWSDLADRHRADP